MEDSRHEWRSIQWEKMLLKWIDLIYSYRYKPTKNIVASGICDKVEDSISLCSGALQYQFLFIIGTSKK